MPKSVSKNNETRISLWNKDARRDVFRLTHFGEAYHWFGLQWVAEGLANISTEVYELRISNQQKRMNN